MSGFITAVAASILLAQEQVPLSGPNRAQMGWWLIVFAVVLLLFWGALSKGWQRRPPGV